MCRVMVTEHDASENTVWLGVRDHAKVPVSIETDEAFDPLAKLASLITPTADI